MSRSMRETRDRRRSNYVCFGSKGDISAALIDVRFTPESGHPLVHSQRPLGVRP
jgi:hypothetical protein